MTKQKLTDSDRKRLLDDAVGELCPIIAGSWNGGRIDRKNEKATRKYGKKFLDAVNNGQTFATEDEAVAAFAPIAVWIFGQIARQIAIAVIKYLWNRLNAPSAVVTAQSR